tara:strand:- start:276 stop:449 length:174 start_codon:yes stop_codon:yes gene_type:complete
MKVGDMIEYENIDQLDTGLVLKVESDGFTGSQALVLWQDGAIQWIATGMCEVISESR